MTNFAGGRCLGVLFCAAVVVANGTPARAQEAEKVAELAVLEGHTAAVLAATFTADGKQVVSGSRDGTVRVWEFAKPKEVKQMKGWGAVHGLVLSKDDDRLLTSQSLLDKWQMHRFDMPTGRSAEFPQNVRMFVGEAITDIAWAKDAPSVVVVSQSGGFFNIVTEKPQSITTIKHEGVERVAVTGDGTLVASAGTDDIQLLHRGRDVKPGHQLKGHTAKKVIRLTFNGDGSRLASAGSAPEDTIRLWDVKTGKEQRAVAVGGQKAARTCVAFSADLGRALCGYDDGSLRAWDLEKGKELWSVAAHMGPVLCVAFAPEGRIAASGGQDKLVRVWGPAKQ